MNVKDLITELQCLPQEAEVYLKYIDKEWDCPQHDPVNVTYVHNDGSVVISETTENN